MAQLLVKTILSVAIGGFLNSSVSAERVLMQFDSLSRLTNAVSSNGSRQSYSYDAAGNRLIRITTRPLLPTIVIQPRDRTNDETSSLMLNVTATGDAPLSYQWQKARQPIPGATDRLFVITNVQSNDAGPYNVIISNSVASVTSSNANLVVKPLVLPTVILGPIINPANGHGFALLSPSTWVAAQAAAIGLGGHLATVRNQAENDWIYNTFSHFAGINRHIWIGGYDTNPMANSTNLVSRRSEFAWISGEPMSFTNWDPVEPNNWDERGEFYGSLMTPDWGASASLWNDNWDTDFNAPSPMCGVVELVVPAFGPVERLGDGSIQLTLFGVPGRVYDILASTNLINWIVLTNVLLTNSIQEFVDRDAKNFSKRYYRLRADSSPIVVNATYNSATDVPVTVSNYVATGRSVNFTLNFAPTTGTELMVVRNTGLGFISGTFTGLTNGQLVTLSFGGNNYNFVVNYYGGTGNDIVLTWKNNRVFAWGNNTNGRLGNNTTINSSTPVAVDTTTNSALFGKTVLAIRAGDGHCLALCSDGTVAAWGVNAWGELGDSTTTNRSVPVAVNVGSNSALFAKTVVAIAAGYGHVLALCSDGTVAGWGWNRYGQLGDGTTNNHALPVAVGTGPYSALFGKQVVKIAAGGGHSLALCSDGTVAAWGDGSYGQLGNNSFLQPNAPVAVSTASNSALFGKTVVEVEAGAEYCTALCSDGSLVSWGENYDGQLGDSTTIRRYVPVLVSTGTNSALYGRAVTAMAPGGRHNLILCSDGTICTCGNNSYGQLGNATSTNRSTTGSVDIGTNSALFGKVVVGIAGGGDHSLALCSDGTLAAWGWNLFGQLGDNTGTNRFVPTAVDISSIGTGSRFIGIFRGEAATYNSFALVALPVP